MSANDRQVGGDHYKREGREHWDIVAEFDLDYFQGQITKYVMRWKEKNGVQDLEKAHHFLEKYLEIARRQYSVNQGVKAGMVETIAECAERMSRGMEATKSYVNQD